MNDELLTVGAAFRGYRVLRRLGVGGTGEVYLARHEALGVDHAVKVIARRQVEGDAEFHARFFREVRIAAHLRHPALVAVHDAGLDELTGLYFVSMDYLPGGTVAEELAKLHRFSIAKALGIARRVAEGLSALGKAGVVHRDVKPSNMLIAEDGSVKLSDFGIARLSAEGVRTITETGFALGTPAYMPFEQIVDSHAVDGRADIYALGVSLYEMLTGILPDGDLSSNQLIKKRVDGVRIPDIRTVNAAIPDALADLIAKMTEPDVNRRLRSPEDLTAALDRLIAAQRPQRRSFGPVRQVRTPISGWAWMLAGALLTLAAVGLSSVFLFEDEIVRKIRGAEDRTSAPKAEVIVPPSPSAGREIVREVVREVTNEVVRTVTVTNFVTRVLPVVAAAKPPVRKVPAAQLPVVLTNVVEGVTVCAPSSCKRELQGVVQMISDAASVVRAAHGLPANVRVQARVRTVALEEGDANSAFDAETRTLRVGAAYGKYPRDTEKMARLCVGFMATYSEGLQDAYNALMNGYVRMLALKKLDDFVGTRDLKRACAKSPELRVLQLADGKGVLAGYFRVRREAYRSGRLSLAMTKHDFAAVLSLACGGSVFPHLRKRGLKVDEFATNVKLHGLPPAAFFGD